MLDPAAATHSGREAERVAKGRSPAAGWVRRRPWPRIFPSSSSSPPRHKQCGGFTTALAPAGEGREGGSALGGPGGGGGAGREGARHLPAPRTTPTQTAKDETPRVLWAEPTGRFPLPFSLLPPPHEVRHPSISQSSWGKGLRFLPPSLPPSLSLGGHKLCLREREFARDGLWCVCMLFCFVLPVGY